MRDVHRLSAIAGVAVALACAQLRAQADPVRICGPDGRPLGDVRVLFVCEEGRTALREAMAWMVTQKRDLLPVEELPGDGAGVVAYTNDDGIAATLDCHGLTWSACVIRGDLGAEAALERPGECGMKAITWQPPEIRLRPLHHVLVLGYDGKPAAGAQVAADSSQRIFEADADGRAAIPDVVATRSGDPSVGARWIAPGSKLVTPWTIKDTDATVMQLAPTGTLVVIDGESSPYQWSSRLHAGDLKRKMDGGRITFPYAAAGAPIELRLDARINAPLVRNVALAPGETKVVTFRGAPRPAVIKGTVSVPPPRPAKLSIVAVFVDREPGESAAEAAIEADGSFEVRLLTRRAALARDVGFIVKPDDVSAPRHSQYAGLRKRLTEPGEDGKFAIGTIAPALIEPWLAGVLTDVHGRPMPNTELSLDARHGCGSYCTGGGTWGADPPSVDDPTRPRLEAWPRIVRTDAEGTFSVTGFHYAGAFEFSFPGSTTGGRRILPEEITVPALDLHLVAENDTPVEVEIDGNAACVPNRRIWLDFDARRVPDPEPARPLVVAAAALIEPPDPEHPEFPEPRCWSCRLQLAPGCWFVTMKVHDDPAVVAEGEIVVSPLPVAASGSDPDTATTEPSRPVYRLQMVRPVPPEAPRLPHQAKVTVVGEDGTPCPEFKVWMRASPKAEWEFCREELGLAVAEFAEDFVEIEATAPGCAPASANVCAGNLTMRLRSLARAQLQVRVAPFPMGVQEGAEWGVHVDFVRPLNATPAESIWTKDPPYCFPEVVVGGSRVEFPLGVPGIYEVRLSGDGLTYATREIEVRSGVALTLDLAVDPASEGMRALTTGIGW